MDTDIIFPFIHSKQSAQDFDPYHFLFDKGNDGVFIYVHGEDGAPCNFIDANKKGCEMLGYTKEEMLRISPVDLIIKEQQEEALKFIDSYLQARNRYMFETILQTKDGRSIDVEISGHLFDYMGRGVTLSIVRDQTDRKSYEQKIENATEQWRNTFDSITDFISVHDKDYKFIRVNRALANFLKKEPKDLIGKYCYEVFHGSEEPWHNCPHQKAMCTHETITELVDDANIGVPLQVRCSPWFNENGELEGTVHVARNISKQLAEEREKEKLIGDLHFALEQVKQLSGLLPICASCKKIRDDKGSWTEIESYIRDHSEAQFSHGICPKCMMDLYPDFVKNRKK